MAGALSWTLGLTDKMSGPGAAMGGVLGALAAKLRTAGDESTRLQQKQDALFKANIGRDAIAKIGKKHAGEESSAKSDLMANMGRWDGIRDEINTAGLKRAKADAEAAAKAMDKLRAASKAASSTPYLNGQASMGKTGANTGGLQMRKPDTNWISTFLQKVNSISPAAANAGSQLVGMAGRAGQALGKLGPIIGAVAGPVGMVVSAIAQIGAVAIGAFALAGGAAARYIGQMQVLKQSTVFAFAASMGSQSKAIAGWDLMAASAMKIGVPLDEMSSSMTKLTSQGFGLTEADELVKRMADLKSVNPAANLDRIATAISQIKAKGKLQAEELQGQLADTGLAPAAVYDILAKQLKTDKAGVIKAMAAGQIDSKMGIDAIKEAMAAQSGGGPAGAMAEKFASTTILGGLGRLQARIGTFAAGLKVDFAPVAGFLDRVGKALMGDSGAKFGKAIESGLNGVIAILDTISEKDIAAVFDAATWAIEKVGSAASFVKSAIEWGGGLSETISKLGIIASITDMLAFSWQIVSNPVQAFVDLLGAVYSRVSMIVGALTGIKLPELPSMADIMGDKGKTAVPNASKSSLSRGASDTDTSAPRSSSPDMMGEAIRKATAPTPSQPQGGSNVAPSSSTSAPTQGNAPTPAQQPRGATTITVSANGLTFEGFEAKVAEICRAEMEKG
jgi:tape measure domain-containing protein